MRRALSITLAAILSAGSISPTWARTEAATQFYTSPTGTGSACTSAAPCSLQAAQTKVRGATSGMTDDIVVNLASGRYELTAPLDLSGALGDGGSGGHRVVYQAAPGAAPVLSGGKAITGWVAAPEAPVAGAVKVDVGNLNTRQLYINGNRAFRAAGPSAALTGLTETATGYTSTNTSILSWNNPEQIEFRFKGGDVDGNWLWAEPRCRAQSISAAPGNKVAIAMAQPCFDLTKGHTWEDDNGVKIKIKPPTAVENSLSFLDQPGEFFLDTAPAGHHMLYYKPRTGENLATDTVIAPVLESVVTSPAAISTPLTNVSFTGITFADTTWLQPNTDIGFAEDSYNQYSQPNDQSSKQIQAGVWLRTAKNIVFERNNFVRMGGAGLSLDNGSQNNLVQGNVFTDLSGNGLEIGNINLSAAEYESGPNMVSDNKVANNYIHHIGLEFPGAAAIWNAKTMRTTITHNEMTKLPRGGIASNFAYQDDDAFIPSGHEISYNKVWDYLNVMEDGGGFDTNGYQAGRSGNGPTSKLIGNVFYAAHNNYGQIYFDHYTSGFLVQNNVAWDTANLNYNTISGNLFQPCCNQQRYNFYDTDDSYKLLPYTDMAVGIGWETPPAAMPASIIANAGLEPAYRSLNPRPAPSDTTAPSAPGQPSLVSLDAGPGATIKWNASTDNVGVTGYEVSNGTAVVAATVAGTRTAAIAGLQPATSYTFTVRARDAAGNLSAASSVNVTTSGGDPSLVGRWQLNQNGNDTSGSGNGADVTDPTWVNGVEGKAMQFNGSTSLVTVHDTDVTNFDHGNMTLVTRFASTSGGWQRMVTNGHYENGPGYAMFWDSGHLMFGLGGRWSGPDDTAVLASTSQTFADGNWHTAVGVVDRAAGTLKIYVDGVAQTLTEPGNYCGTPAGTKLTITGCRMAAASSNDQLTFGGYLTDDGQGGYHPVEQYNGKLDDVRLYSRALTAAEVAAL